jgi:hypothetical protein
MPKNTKCLGFEFTPEEEREMRFHIRRANEFMQTYGKGYEPPKYVGGTVVRSRKEYNSK